MHVGSNLQTILILVIRMLRRVDLRRLVGPAALAALGAALLIVARTQPAWVGPRVGPGLVAQAMAAGVVALAVLWALARLRERGEGGAGRPARASASPLAGVCLLASVAAFALLLPPVGLVPAAAAAAALAALGAGERRAGGLVLTAGVGAGLAAGIGAGLMGPAATLWSWPWPVAP
jgi:hypothetical protein